MEKENRLVEEVIIGKHGNERAEDHERRNAHVDVFVLEELDEGWRQYGPARLRGHDEGEMAEIFDRPTTHFPVDVPAQFQESRHLCSRRNGKRRNSRKCLRAKMELGTDFSTQPHQEESNVKNLLFVNVRKLKFVKNRYFTSKTRQKRFINSEVKAGRSQRKLPPTQGLREGKL